MNQCEYSLINEDEKIYQKLLKLRRPKPPKKTSAILSNSFFWIKPNKNIKSYYFCVPENEINSWLNLIKEAREGPNSFKKILNKNTQSSTNTLKFDLPASSKYFGPSSFASMSTISSSYNSGGNISSISDATWGTNSTSSKSTTSSKVISNQIISSPSTESQFALKSGTKSNLKENDPFGLLKAYNGDSDINLNNNLKEDLFKPIVPPLKLDDSFKFE